ncbi:MAG: tetratricopeptide repeat protein, partial [Firmicutes bacterium]|nr:tetratricopeptide repeat protein [Bacillota bacterium]
AHTKAEKWLNTKTLFDDIIKNYPADIAYAHAYSVRGDWFRENEMNKEAEKDLNLALFFDEDADLAKFSLAAIMQEKGRYDEALDLYASLPEDDINIAKAYTHFANIYYKHRRDAKTAHEIVENALKQFPNDFFLYMTLGNFYNFEERFDKAEESFKKAKKIYPDNREPYLNLADVYNKTGRDDLAAKEYAEYISKYGEDGFIYNKLGGLHFKSGSYDAAEKIFAYAAKLDPNNYEAYNYLGRIYAMKEEYKKASYYFTLSILTNKDYVPSYFHRAAIHLITENYLKAEQDAIMVKKLGGIIPEDFKNEIREKSGIIL